MRRLSLSIPLFFFMAVLSACSYTTVKTPSSPKNLHTPPDTIEIGPVNLTNVPFYEGLEEGLNSLPDIKVVRYFSGDEHGLSSLVLRGDLKVNARDGFGEKVSRHLFGFGVNRREVNGHFEIEDSNHETVMSFKASEYYNGGTGLGGLVDVPGWIIGPFVEGIPYFCQADIISTDTMQKRLGVEVGKKIRGWFLTKTL